MEDQAARLRADAWDYGLDGSALTDRVAFGLPLSGFKQTGVGHEGEPRGGCPAFEMTAILIDALPAGV